MHQGHFWIPPDRGEWVSGKVMVPQGGPVVLELDGQGTTIDLFGDDIPVIHGVTAAGRALTVVGARRESLFRFGTGQGSAAYVVEAAYIGGHLASEDLFFNEVRVRLTHLNEWVASGAVRTVFPLPDEPLGRFTLQFDPIEPRMANIGIGEVVLETLAETTAYDSDLGADITQAAQFRIESDVPRSFREWYGQVISPLQDLITFATGSPNAVIRTTVLTPKSDQPGLPKGGRHVLRVIHDPIYATEDVQSRIYKESMLFRLSDVGDRFDSLLNRWLEIRHRAKAAMDVFLLTYYFPMPYVELPFLFRAQAGESYHRSFPRFRQVAWRPAAYDQLLNALAGALSDTERRWVTDRLRNQPSYRERIEVLVQAAGGVVKTQLPSNFSSNVRNTRDRLSHLLPPTESYGANDGAQLEFLSSALRLVLESCLLRDLDFPEVVVDGLISESPSYRHVRALRQLQ